MTSSSPVKRGNDIVSLSTPEITNTDSSGCSTSLSSNGLETRAVVGISKSFNYSLNEHRSFQSLPYADCCVSPGITYDTAMEETSNINSVQNEKSRALRRYC